MLRKSLFCLLMVGFAASSLFAGNLFSNSGFETNLSGWSLSFHDTTLCNAKISLDTVDVKFGKKYCKVDVTKVEANADTAAAHNWYIQLWEPTWTAKKNVYYTFSFWGKSGDSSSHVVKLAVTGDSASEYNYRTSKECNFTQTWQRFDTTFAWGDNDGTTKKHFRFFLAQTKGIVCFDSMALDSNITTMAKTPFTLSNRNETFNYGVQLLPSCMRIVLGNSALQSNNVAIYSLEGRLLSSQNIPSATRSFELAKPAPGAWVVKVNSEKKVVQVH